VGAVIAELCALIVDLRQLVERQAARIEELERQRGRNSSNSGRPPSSDPVFDKPARPRSRSSRSASGRRPGKQPGEGGSTMRLVAHPDETIECPPAECAGCGADLAGAPVTASQRRQVTPTTQEH
jgi:transposase